MAGIRHLRPKWARSADRIPDMGPAAGRAADKAATEAANEIVSIAAEMEHGGGPAEAEPSLRRERGRQQLASLADALSRGGRTAARGARIGVRSLADRLIEASPRIPVRDLATLRAQYPDAVGAEQLADRLTASAVKASASVGAGVGAVATLPTPPAMPMEIAAETLAVAAIEIKLIAELHEVYGVPASGGRVDRATAYVTAWTNRRGIELGKPVGLAALSLSRELKQQLRRRLARSTARRVPSLLPLMIGAGIGAAVNHRDTHRLAREVRADLRKRTPSVTDYWAAALPMPPVTGAQGS